jgi:hypothetical protein
MNELSRQFSDEEKPTANKYMNKCSTTLAIKEMQIKSYIKELSTRGSHL